MSMTTTQTETTTTTTTTTAASAADTFTIEPKGPFSLQEAAMFGFGQRHDVTFDGAMRLAFCVDDLAGHAGVALTQAADSTVHGTIAGVAGAPRRSGIVAQVARMLSLDHDATGYAALGDADPVIGRLLAAAPGLRPPLFHSPYEAALWAVLSARRPMRTADSWRRKLSVAAGAGFEIEGRDLFAVPRPERLLELGPTGCAQACGIEAARAERVVGVADAATRGLLDAVPLARMDLDDARRQLRTIPGIGPFYADLILIRATGLTDVLANNEPKVLAIVGELHALGRPANQAELEQLAAGWRPWRTWVTVLYRAAGARQRA